MLPGLPGILQCQSLNDFIKKKLENDFHYNGTILFELS